jgi:hypothetical protein
MVNGLSRFALNVAMVLSPSEELKQWPRDHALQCSVVTGTLIPIEGNLDALSLLLYTVGSLLFYHERVSRETIR